MPLIQPQKMFWLSLLVVNLLGCGSAETPNLTVTYSGQNAFSNAQVVDVVYTAQSKTVNGVGLDANNDGIADQFIYPTACGNPKPAGCGFPVANSGLLDIGVLPLGFQYDLRVEFRDASGAILFCGETTFQNQEGTQSLQVPVVAGTCP